MADFYDHFQKNMEALGLPAPQSLFGSVSAAVGNAAALLNQIDRFGKDVTIGEIIGTGTSLESLGCIAGCAAVFYVGAVIGSLAVASGKSLAGSTSLADVLYTAKAHKLDRKWLPATLQRWPGLYDRRLVAARTHLRAMAVA
jgi:hypothetical protein